MNSNIAAYRDGWLAHKNSIKVEYNPYHEMSQQHSHRQWLSGWRARSSMIEHRQDVSNYDNEYTNAW